MDELEIVLASYREMFAAKTERGNEIHKAACIELARLQQIERVAIAALREITNGKHSDDHNKFIATEALRILDK